MSEVQQSGIGETFARRMLGYQKTSNGTYKHICGQVEVRMSASGGWVVFAGGSQFSFKSLKLALAAGRGFAEAWM